MGVFWELLCLTLLAAGLAAEVRSKRSEENVITVDSPECEVSDKVMFCDYEGSKEEPLYIGPLQNSQIQMVFLNNMKELYLDECVSVNISATTIQKISIKPSKNVNCSNFALSVKHSNISEIPKFVSQLYLEGCNIVMLKPGMSLSKLLVISSQVQRLEVAIPLAEGTMAIIHSSEIIHFERYTAYVGSTLTIKETKINSFSPDAIEMGDGKIIWENLTLTEATFQIKGSFTMTPVVKAKTTAIKSDIPDQSCEPRDDTYYYLFCFFLFLFLVSWIAFGAYLFNHKILEFFRVMLTPDQPKEGPTENEQRPLVTLPTGNSKGTKTKNERCDTAATDVNKINDKIKTKIEMLSSQFDRDRQLHAEEIKVYDELICNINESEISKWSIKKKQLMNGLTKNLYHMDKLDDTEREFEALICDMVTGAWNGNRDELKSETGSETDSKNGDPVPEVLSTSGNCSVRKKEGTGLCAGNSTKTSKLHKTMKLELDGEVNHCLSQCEQRLSYLRGGQPPEDAKSQFLFFKWKGKNEKNVHENQQDLTAEESISKALPPSLKKSYEEFWEKVKNIKELDKIFGHIKAEIEEAILNFQVSTFKIMVRFQENRIAEMRNNTNKFTTSD